MARASLTELLSRDLQPELLARRALELLEMEDRRLALLALGDWGRCGIPSPELFAALPPLQRPSWGAWNGLLAALQKAREASLKHATPEARRCIKDARLLAAILDARKARLGSEPVEAVRPLAERCGASLGKRPRVSHALGVPITLRNRIAHDHPAAEAWWEETAAALRRYLRWYLDRPEIEAAPEDHRFPWFLAEDDERHAYIGLEAGKPEERARYGRGDASRFSTAGAAEVRRQFHALLGKEAREAESLRHLFGRLAPEDSKGVLLGDVLVGAKVGAGAFATVHRGHQLSTGRKVAVKVLRDGLDEEARARFEREGRYLSGLSHPHIVRVLDSGRGRWRAPRAISLDEEAWYREVFKGKAAEKSYLVLEWLEGESGADLYERGSRGRPAATVPALTEAFAQTAGALAAVHGRGLIHRDIKPSNLMFTAAGVKLLDFGIANSKTEAETSLTGERGRLGTLAYMSPEQLEAEDAEAEVGPASDIYSLCATFYELFTRTRLYDHDARGGLASSESARRMGVAAEPPRRRAPGLSWELETLLMKGLEPELWDRLGSAEQLERDLRRVERDEPIITRRPSLARRAFLAYRRNAGLWNLAAAALALGVVGAVFYVVSLRAEQARTAFERDRAVEGLRLSRSALQTLTIETRDRLLDVPGQAVRAARQELLARALELLEELELLDAGEGPAARYQTAEVLIQIGDLRAELGEGAGALEALDQALAILASLKEDPEELEPASRKRVEELRAIARDRLGDAASEHGDQEGARRHYEAVIAFLRAHPGAQIGGDGVPGALRKLAILHVERGRFSEAEGAISEALTYLPELGLTTKQRWLRATLYAVRGEGLQLRGQRARAQEVYAESVRDMKAVVASRPGSLTRRRDLANFAMQWAHALQSSDPARVLEACKVSLEAANWILEIDPGNATILANKAEALRFAGAAYLSREDTEEAGRCFRESVALLRPLVSGDGASGIFRSRFSGALSDYARFLTAMNQPREALCVVEERESLVGESEGSRGDYSGRRRAVIGLLEKGRILQELGRNKESLKPLDEALRMTAEAELNPERAGSIRGQVLNQRAGALWTLGRLTEARDGYQSTAQLFARLRQQNPADSIILSQEAAALGNLGQVLRKLGEQDAAFRVNRQAVEIDRRRVELFPSDRRALHSLARQLRFLAEDYADRGDDRAEATYQESEAIARRLAQGAQRRESFELLPNVLERRAADASSRGDYAASEALYNEAIKIFENGLQRWASDRFLEGGLAIARFGLSRVLEETGRAEDATVMARSALALRESLADRFPRDHDARRRQAEGQQTLAKRLASRRQLAPAFRESEAAIAFWRKVLEDFGAQRGDLSALAVALTEAAGLSRRIGGSARSLVLCEESLALLEPLYRAAPEDVDLAWKYAGALETRGLAFFALDRAQEAIAAQTRVVALRLAIAERRPTNLIARGNLAMAYLNLGRACLDGDDLGAARAHFEQAQTRFSALIRADGGRNLQSHSRLAGARRGFASVLEQSGGLDDEACAIWRDNIAALEKLRDRFPGQGLDLELNMNCDKLAWNLKRRGRAAEALPYFRKGLALTRAGATGTQSVAVAVLSDLCGIYEVLGTLGEKAERSAVAKEIRAALASTPLADSPAADIVAVGLSCAVFANLVKGSEGTEEAEAIYRDWVDRLRALEKGRSEIEITAGRITVQRYLADLVAERDPKAAMPLRDRLIEETKPKLSAHPELTELRDNLAWLFQDQGLAFLAKGDNATARPLFRASLDHALENHRRRPADTALLITLNWSGYYMAFFHWVAGEPEPGLLIIKESLRRVRLTAAKTGDPGDRDLIATFDQLRVDLESQLRIQNLRSGKIEPRTFRERVEVAYGLYERKQFPASVAAWSSAFASGGAAPTLNDHYNAACAAALAGAAAPDAERTPWVDQAFAWLAQHRRALDARRKAIAKAKPRAEGQELSKLVTEEKGLRDFIVHGREKDSDLAALRGDSRFAELYRE